MDIKIDKNGIWVSQAVKGGYIFCEMGGGLRYVLPIKHKTKGQSPRQWADMPGNTNINESV